MGEDRRIKQVKTWELLMCCLLPPGLENSKAFPMVVVIFELSKNVLMISPVKKKKSIIY